MTISEKIRLLLFRRGMTITTLAKRIGISRQYMTVKLRKNDFSVADLQKIAAVLNCELDIVFTMYDTEEKL